MQIKPAHAFFAPALLAVALGLGACGKQDNKDQQQQQQKPAEVGVVTVQPRTVTLTDELPGRTSAFRIAEVRPQVSGILLKRSFTEGADVKAGQQLYQIDPRTYEANVN
ncbi:biotin/lipoyl-binding protein, partial [Pseudomonas sp. BAV 2493]|uniref:biotin/lipoyl-binding protein n=2 Tax=unclassified Pseudomonas TaxID=196821 RepID=UPI00131AA41E